MRVTQAGVFAAGASIGILATAWLNQYLYGSPLLSGYGRLEDLFAWRHVVPNLRSYFAWYAESQHPIALVGFAALALPSSRIWPGVTDRSVFIAIGLYVALLWGQYVAYLQFDSWGFLRFLLPSWPFLMLGVASVLVAIARLPRGRAAGIAGIVVAMSSWRLASGISRTRRATACSTSGRRSVTKRCSGRSFRSHDPNSVIITIQRSGSVRYYGGRVTLRYDYLAHDTLDRDIDWLRGRGVRAFALMDAREIEEFKRQFAGQRTLAAFDRPVLVYEPAGVSLVDLSRPPDVGEPRPFRVTEAPPDGPDCVPPVPAPRITWGPGR